MTTFYVIQTRCIEEPIWRDFGYYYFSNREDAVEEFKRRKLSLRCDGDGVPFHQIVKRIEEKIDINTTDSIEKGEQRIITV